MKVLYIFLVFIFSISSAIAQQSYTISSDESSVLIIGTSSVHDWESTAEEFSGSASFTLAEGELQSINGLRFSVVVESIKSGKRIMDNKTRGALESKDHPEIIFEFQSLEGINEDSIKVAGNLSLAGITKEIMLSAAYQIQENGSILVSGIQAVDMEDYDIKPPTAMMGALKTGKDVDVEYRITFSKN